MPVRWITAFIDRPASSFDACVAFWCAVTGSTTSEWRGDRRQFATLVPPDGDAHLRVQRVDDGPGGTHLDLHVDDVVAAARTARVNGATLVRDDERLVVLRSPGGLGFCLTGHQGEHRRSSARRVEGSSTGVLVDQVCIDVGPHAADEELSFWSAVTGRPARRGRLTEFAVLEHPDASPVRVLVQRLDDEPADGRATAHLDLACGDDVDAVARLHVALGATEVSRHRYWTVLEDPSGLPYCLTRRDPATGVIAS